MHFVIKFAGQEYHFDVEDPANLHDVKASIWSITGVALERQRLFGLPRLTDDFEPLTLPPGKSHLTLLLTERADAPLPVGITPPAFEEDQEAPTRPDSEVTPTHYEVHTESDEEYPPGPTFPTSGGNRPAFSVEADNPEDAAICGLLYSVSPYSHDDLSHAFSTARRERRPVIVIMLNEMQSTSQNLAAMWGTMPEMSDLAQRSIVWVSETHNATAMHTFGSIASRIPEFQDELQHHVRDGLIQCPSVFVFAPGAQRNELWFAEYGCEASSMHHILMILDERGVREGNPDRQRVATPPPMTELEAERTVIRSEYEAALEEDRRRDEATRQQAIEAAKEASRLEDEAKRARAIKQEKQALVEKWLKLECPDGVRAVVRKRDGSQSITRVPQTTSVRQLIEFAFGSDADAKALRDVQVCTMHPRKVFKYDDPATGDMTLAQIDSPQPGSVMLVVELVKHE